jgi:hypothetical protein
MNNTKKQDLDKEILDVGFLVLSGESSEPAKDVELRLICARVLSFLLPNLLPSST